jgi:hypothetical protein
VDILPGKIAAITWTLRTRAAPKLTIARSFENHTGYHNMKARSDRNTNTSKTDMVRSKIRASEIRELRDINGFCNPAAIAMAKAKVQILRKRIKILRRLENASDKKV